MSGSSNAFQGVLNRVRANLIVASNPSLNILADNLGVDGISVSPSHEGTLTIPQMVGVVQSPAPYQMMTMVAELIKTQALAFAWRDQFENYSLIGNITIITDAPGFPNFNYFNCAMTNWDGMHFNGTEASYKIHLSGYYAINNQLFDM